MIKPLLYGYLCWRSLSGVCRIVGILDVLKYTPDACPAHAEEPPPYRLGILINLT